MKNRRAWYLFISILFFSGQLAASHLRAADIVAERVVGSNTRYRIILKVYTDWSSVSDAGSSGPIDFRTVDIRVSSQNDPITLTRSGFREIVPGVTNENIFEYEVDFPSVNQLYTVSYEEDFRNFGVRNVPSSGAVPIYVETKIFIDALSPINSTPNFTVPPIDLAATNRIYTHNPGAYDPDGDSLFFELITPLQTRNTPISGYLFPDDSGFGLGSDFRIDSKSGQITWDTPLLPGEYNIAFRVNEIRDGFTIGSVIRDMQILVEDSDNDPPVLFLPKDTCIAHTALYRERFFTSDPNNDRVEVELFGGVTQEGAFISSIQRVRMDSLVADIEWRIGCDQIARLPIQATVKALDDGSPNLSSFGNWEITVIGESPRLVSATPNQNQIQLQWEPYDCNTPGARIQIYRFECDTNQINRSSCQSGVPADWGGVLVGETGIGSVGFVDDSPTLIQGISYYYMIAVDFGTPSFGQSYASNLVEVSLGGLAPLITEATFLKETGDQQVRISWDHFGALDATGFIAPFTYSVLQSNRVVSTQTSPLPQAGSVTVQTAALDPNLALVIRLEDAQMSPLGTTSPFYLEKSTSSGSDQTLNLTWTALNGWFKPDSLTQKIFAFVPSQDTVLVDSVSGSTLEHQLTGLANGDTVCAYVEYQFVYCIEGVDSVFSSFTSTSCDLVRDNVPPCPPLLRLEPIDCEASSTGNQLDWQFDPSPECTNDVEFFTLFTSESTEDDQFERLATFPNTQRAYLDTLGSELRCYFLVATDSSGNASEPSGVVCQDFCGDLRFPNIFTPNADGKNDFLVPEGRIVGLEDIKFEVYNRWGKVVYRTKVVEEVSWDGQTMEGNMVSQGVYYILFSGTRIGGSQQKVSYKGWVQLIR